MAVHALDHVRVKIRTHHAEVKPLVCVDCRDLRVWSEDPVVACLSGDLRTTDEGIAINVISEKVRECVCPGCGDCRPWIQFLRQLGHANIQDSWHQSKSSNGISAKQTAWGIAQTRDADGAQRTVSTCKIPFGKVAEVIAQREL